MPYNAPTPNGRKQLALPRAFRTFDGIFQAVGPSGREKIEQGRSFAAILAAGKNKQGFISMRAIAVTGIKDLALSDGGKQASFTLATKYAGDLAVTMPAQCLDALKLPDGGAALKPPGNGATAPSSNGAATPARAGSDPNPNSVTVTVPQKWLVAANADNRRHVVIVFDRGMPTEAGFALGPEAAKALAAAMTKNADEILARGAGKEN